MQQPVNTSQVPESMQTVPAHVAEKMPAPVASIPDAKFRISDATPQNPEVAPAAPADLPSAVSLPITADTGEFHPIQQPNMDTTEPVVTSPTPNPSMRG